MVRLVVPGIEPVATLDVAVIVMGLVVTLTRVASPAVVEVKLASAVLADHVTEEVMSCVVATPE
jgi:hypothetical protein